MRRESHRKLFCLQCGNQCLHDVQSEYSKTDFDVDGYNCGEHTYMFVVCSTCEQPSVHYEEEDEFQPVWPINSRLDSSVPGTVQRHYRGALLVKHRLPSAFAVQIRRALEAMCTERGIGERSLARSLKVLTDQLVLPETIQNVANMTRILGNKGAHDGDDVTDAEARALDEFFLALVEYVYIAPNKLARYNRALELLSE